MIRRVVGPLPLNIIFYISYPPLVLPSVFFFFLWIRRPPRPTLFPSPTLFRSPAVIAEGGRTVYLAGQTTLADENGANIAGNFEAQTRTIFKLMDKTLQRAGGALKNLVTMRSEEHTSELQSRLHLVCRLLLEKK